ncbi:MAG: FAD-dependent monooxygenase [Pseudonocardiales bacterium]|nr:FAD-dependent monooxygenase [Pseudonocardiales bacterium]
MKVVCVGGGPAGLYFAISAKLRSKNHNVTVVERNPAGVTYGWGVVFWDDLLDELYRNDPVSARQIRDSSVTWGGQEVHVHGEHTAYLGGYGYSLDRQRLLDVLVERAKGLDIDVQFERAVQDVSDFANADLVVACDGINSLMRQLHSDHLETDIEIGRNKYIWLGTQRIFDSFTFAFEETAAGWIWFHAYRFDAHTSTLIVECPPETWVGLGFNSLESDQAVKLLEKIFERHLGNHSLINESRGGIGKARWLNFKRVNNNNWYYNNVALMGDAAHTTHFTIGSGTTLAMGDAIALAEKLEEHKNLTMTLAGYQNNRRAALLAMQREALNSAKWFEDVPHHINQNITQFSYSLWKRRGHSPLWRYPLHLATQITILRNLRRSLGMAKRGLRGHQREKLLQSGHR